MREEQTQPLSSLVSLVSARTSGIKNPALPYVGLEHIPGSGSLLNGVGAAYDSVSTNGVFQAGDILFGKLRPRLRKSVRVNHPGYCSTDILVLRPTPGADPAFSGYVAQSDEVFSAAIRTEEGTKMPRCSWRDISRVRVYCPRDKGAQARIAAILSSLDTAIEKTEALIEKHQQIKAGLLHALFTRGMSPDGQIRPTVQIAPHLYRRTPLGFLPQEWRETTCASECSIDSGITLGPHRRPDKNPFPYLRVGNVFRDDIRLADVAYLEAFRGEEAMSLKVGDLLVVEGHASRAEIGRCAMADERCAGMLFQNHLFRLRAVGVSPSFALHWLNSRHTQAYWDRSCATSSGLNTINRKMLARVPIYAPYPPEQARIGSAIEAARAQEESASAIVEKLKSKRQGLMQALLTGRVAVPTSIAEPVTTNA